MRLPEYEWLGGELWKSGGRTGDLEPLLRTFLAQYSITLERVVIEDGSLHCVVRGPLSPLDGVSVGVVLENLRAWLPQPFRIEVIADSSGEP